MVTGHPVAVTVEQGPQNATVDHALEGEVMGLGRETADQLVALIGYLQRLGRNDFSTEIGAAK